MGDQEVKSLPKRPRIIKKGSVESQPKAKPTQERIIVTDPEASFTCQSCNASLKQWLLYIDQPCFAQCYCCVKCLYTNKRCVCGRELTASELEMVTIYYQTFLPSDWPLDRLLS